MIGFGEEYGYFVYGHRKEGRVQTLQGGKLWGKGQLWRFSYWYLSFSSDVEHKMKGEFPYHLYAV